MSQSGYLDTSLAEDTDQAALQDAISAHINTLTHNPIELGRLNLVENTGTVCFYASKFKNLFFLMTRPFNMQDARISTFDDSDTSFSVGVEMPQILRLDKPTMMRNDSINPSALRL